SEAADIQIWSAQDLDAPAAVLGLTGSLTQVIKTFSPKQKREVTVLEGTGAEIAAALAAKLMAHNLISG
ncbi:MAG: electron transfer flavoprotein subunit beta, partial [Deltaproteobacteria bacterium]|nr:electron transfer flavoprotein subunit beta [Deltaproteobacteria bacterium]